MTRDSFRNVTTADRRAGPAKQRPRRRPSRLVPAGCERLESRRLLTEVGSDIASDTIWDPAHIPDRLITMHKDVTIKAGATLTIGAGMTIQTFNGAILYVGSGTQGNGTLKVNGASLAALITVQPQSGADSQIVGSTLTAGRITINEGAALALSGDTFSTQTPLSVTPDYVPSIVGPASAPNKFAPNTTILLPINSSLSTGTAVTWPSFAGLSSYQIYDPSNRYAGNLYVDSGSTLNLAQGVQVTAQYTNDYISVGTGSSKGTLVANAGANTLNAATVFGGNGTGLIANATVGGFMTQYAGAALTLSNDTFTLTQPLQVTPDYVPNIVGPASAPNKFAPNTTILLPINSSLSTGTAVTWPSFAGLSSYQIYDPSNRYAGNLYVDSGSTLNLALGVHVTAQYTNDVLLVGTDPARGAGTLNANDATFGLSVNLGGLAKGSLQEDAFTGPYLAIGTNAAGSSSVAFLHNDFSTLGANQVIVYGSSTGTVNLTRQFWGTNAPATVVKDHADETARPTANTGSAVPLNSVGNRVWNDLNGDGIQNTGEPGYAGVTVTLYDSGADGTAGTADDRAIGNAAVTDAYGNYLVSFPAQTNDHPLFLKLSNLPAGFVGSPRGKGGNPFIDNDFDPATLATPTYVSLPDNFRADLDAGIYQPQAPALTSAPSTVFTTGVAGSYAVTAQGTPKPTLAESGALPSGVTFNPATGALAGTPAAGTGNVYVFTVTATNAKGSAAQTFVLTVIQPAAITSANTTTFTVGAAGTFAVKATGFPAPSLTESGTLPSGVTFDPATGAFRGTPAANTAGSYPVTVTATNGVNTVAQAFTLKVVAAGGALTAVQTPGVGKTAVAPLAASQEAPGVAFGRATPLPTALSRTAPAGPIGIDPASVPVTTGADSGSRWADAWRRRLRMMSGPN